MLVLTRKTNQSVMIGDDIEISVLAVSRDKIRIGITAPRDVPVFRKEVYLSIKDEEATAEADEDADTNDEDGADGSARRRVDSALGKLAKSE
jgi:carbon storage regulator